MYKIYMFTVDLLVFWFPLFHDVREKNDNNQTGNAKESAKSNCGCMFTWNGKITQDI